LCVYHVAISILVVYIFQGFFMTQKFCTTWWCYAPNGTTVPSQLCHCVYIVKNRVLLQGTKLGKSPILMTILIKKRLIEIYCIDVHSKIREYKDKYRFRMVFWKRNPIQFTTKVSKILHLHKRNNSPFAEYKQGSNTWTLKDLTLYTFV
jgi:hypothetical protein